MALKQTNIIDPYVPWTGWGDYAVNDDINAITEYIENQRPKIKDYPQVQSVIEEYEQWLINLSWFEKYMTPNNTLGKAVFYRDQINDIIGQRLPETSIPADILNKIVSVDPSKSDSAATTFIKQFIPTSIVRGIGIVLTGGIIIYLFGPAIKTFATKRTEQYFAKKEYPNEQR